MQEQAVRLDQDTPRRHDSTDGGRIQALRRRYREEVPRISIERARYFTEKWRETEGQRLSPAVRVALAMKHVYAHMTHHVEPEDRIAGYWTESFLGIPIDIERGVFNQVLASELDKGSMARFRARAFKDMFSYLLRQGQFKEFLRGMKVSRASGQPALNLGLQVMTGREINRFAIDPGDKQVLKKELLPFWEGRSVVDLLQTEILGSGVLNRDMREFAYAMPANTSRQTIMLSTSATVATIQGHVLVDHERVLRQGLLAMREEIERQKGEARLPAEEMDFLEATAIALDGIMLFATRLAEKIRELAEQETDPGRKRILDETLANCSVVPLRPAENFRQAVQAAWTLKTALELAHPVNLHCFGRLDQILYPYYAEDLRQGRLSRPEAREVLEELLLKTMSQNIRPESNILSHFYHRYLGSTPVTVGGLKPDGSDASNDLTYLFLEAAQGSRAVTNVSLRVHAGTPDGLLLAAAAALHAGCSNLSLFNDDVNVEAMRRRGFREEDARDYAVAGCVELVSPGRTGGLSVNALLLSRVLDLTLRNGDALTIMGRIRNMGLRTGDPDAFASFEELLDAFVRQANHQVQMIVQASNLRDELYARVLPAPLLSPFVEGCLETRRDVTRGGARYDVSGISYINSIANAADSLHAIRKLVFERKAFTVRELLEATDSNFRRHPEILRQIHALRGMWGNGEAETDELVRNLTSRLFRETYRHRSWRGGVFVPFVISMITHTVDGRISIATPDGRRAATPYAASCNPYNVEKQGVTGALRSVAAIDFRDVLGCAVNMKFHPSAIGEREESRRKWVSLLRTYFQLGGAQLQPTVVSAATLRAARQDPSNYGDLVVKVGGYSAYFTELGREIQEEVIARTEHWLPGENP